MSLSEIVLGSSVGSAGRKKRKDQILIGSLNNLFLYFFWKSLSLSSFVGCLCVDNLNQGFCKVFSEWSQFLVLCGGAENDPHIHDKESHDGEYHFCLPFPETMIVFELVPILVCFINQVEVDGVEGMQRCWIWEGLVFDKQFKFSQRCFGLGALSWLYQQSFQWIHSSCFLQHHKNWLTETVLTSSDVVVLADLLQSGYTEFFQFFLSHEGNEWSWRKNEISIEESMKQTWLRLGLTLRRALVKLVNSTLKSSWDDMLFWQQCHSHHILCERMQWALLDKQLLSKFLLEHWRTTLSRAKGEFWLELRLWYCHPMPWCFQWAPDGQKLSQWRSEVLLQTSTCFWT